MRDPWKRRIDRAEHLAERDEAARSLLLAYRRLLLLQRDCDRALRGHADRLTGSLDRDLALVRPCLAPVLEAVASADSEGLAAQARDLQKAADAALDAMLLAGWRTPDGRSFFPRIVLEPYTQVLASLDVRPQGRGPVEGHATCPFCGGAPQLACLQPAGDADGGGRRLLCGTCLTAWSCQRLLCPRCGEEDERRLGYFHAPAFDHLRLDVCDTCRHYLKTVDLTRLGIAVPIVDEVAGAPLDIWAAEHGYQKIELNLVGL